MCTGENPFGKPDSLNMYGRVVTPREQFRMFYRYGQQLQAEGKAVQARRCYSQALDLFRDSIRQAEESLQLEYAEILFEMGRALLHPLDERRDALIECLDLRNRCLNPFHQDVERALLELSRIHESLEEYDFALQCWEEILCIRLGREEDGPGHWLEVSRLQRLVGKEEEAEESYREARRLLTER